MNSLGQSSASALDVLSPVSMPQEVNFTLPPSLPITKNTTTKLQPINGSSFSTGAGSNVIQFDLPAGKRGSYIDTLTTFIRFKATYTGATLPSSTNNGHLMGSAASYFSKLEVYGNNSNQLESIGEYGAINNQLFNLQLNDADKRGLSTAMGFDHFLSSGYDSAVAAHYINFDTMHYGTTFEYSIPLMSGVLGCLATEKLFPIGAIYGCRLEMTVDNFSNFFKAVSTATTAPTGCTLSEVELVYNVIELSPDAQALIDHANPDKLRIRTTSYRYTSNVLAASSSATQDLLVGIRLSSLKSIFMTCGPSNVAEGYKYGSVCPNLQQGSCYIIASNSYPARCLDPANHSSEAFMETQKALGALSMTCFNGCLGKQSYNVGSTAYGVLQAYNSTLTTSALKNTPNMWVLGLDVESFGRRSGSLLSGLNVNSTPMFFRAVIGSSLAAVSHTVHFWGYYDMIIEIDIASKNIVAKF